MLSYVDPEYNDTDALVQSVTHMKEESAGELAPSYTIPRTLTATGNYKLSGTADVDH